tara:strand:- start:14578 stop:14823 length:246 start_codon:yes stop_codon:yes gene_type:complete
MINKKITYWKLNLIIISVLIIIWFMASLGFGVIFADSIDHIKIGGFKLGFWFAQQGSIIIFLLLILIYVLVMNIVDKKFKD